MDLLGLPGVTAWDLRRGLPTSLLNLDYAYSEHFIEHITKKDAARLLADVHRALRPGGVLRLSTPDLEELVNVYLNGPLDEWEDVSWVSASRRALLNEGMRSWGHLYLYDFEELASLLAEVGFDSIERVNWRESTHQELTALECRPFHNEVIVEASKP